MRPTVLLATAILLAGNAYATENSVSITGNKAAEDTRVFEQRGSEFIRNLHPGLKIALGALVPGLPQYLQGQWRSYAYFTAEAAGIAGLVFYNAQAHDRRGRYYVMAREARRSFTLGGLRNNPAEVPDHLLGGYGEYYEDLTKWASSGDYDNDPSREGIQPETDRRTYNGHQWDIAKINNYSGTSGGLPVAMSTEEEARALEAYTAAVYPIEYNWDWSGLDGVESTYHRMFDSAEVSYRRRNNFTIILLANHIFSAIDMLIMEKINQTHGMRENHLDLGLYPRSDVTGRQNGLSLEMVLTRTF